MSKELEKDLIVIYNLLCQIVLFAVKSIFLGIKVLWQKRSLLVFLLTVVVIILSYSIHLLFNSIYITVIPGLFYIFVPGIIKNFSMLLLKSKSKVFIKINFKDKNGCYPKIIKIIKYKRNREIIICKSFIPLKTWLDNRDLLETGFNSKLKIIQDTKQTIKLIKLGR